MFGFGIFSTHLPYVALLVGYIACWLWSAQNRSESDVAAELSGQQAQILCPAADDEAPSIFSFDTFVEPFLGDSPLPVVRYAKEKPPHFLCGEIDQGCKTYIFLRPPPTREV
jgi:hypothetical protein